MYRDSTVVKSYILVMYCMYTKTMQLFTPGVIILEAGCADCILCVLRLSGHGLEYLKHHVMFLEPIICKF